MTLQMDPYKVLGVSPDAQIQEIRQAHRKLVLKCHPDKVQDPQQKAIKQDEFQRVQQAYEILSDEVQREKYDDQVKLAELRRQYQNKPNTSAPRSTKYPDVEIRTAEPRPKSYREGPPPPPQGVKVSYTYSRSHEEMRGPRYYEAEMRPRRGESYHEAKPSKREAEKEREKKDDKERRKRKEAKEREKRERDEEEARRAAKKEEKRQRERREAKEKKQSKEEKRRDREPQHPYIEDDFYEEPQPMPRKPSRKHDDPRERSSGRDEPKLRRSVTDTGASKADAAREYIHRARDGSGLERSQSYHAAKPPAAPTPPPTAGGAPIFPVPEDEPIHRSSARPRRGSNDGPYTTRERPIHRSSQDPIREDPILAHDSPAARSAPRYAEAPLGSSPPRVGRTHTMPIPMRPGPPPQRSQTFTEDRSANRGRGRSKMYAQHELEESEDEYDEPRRSGKHRSSRKTRSPEHYQPSSIRYKVNGGKTTQYDYPEQRRPYYGGEGYSYEPARSYPAFRESKPIRPDDINYSNYPRGAYGTAQA